jgi:hypothetical protein
MRGIPLGEWSGSDAIRELHESIKEFNRKTTKQTTQLVILTWVLAVLTFLMLVGLGFQIYLAVRTAT